MKILLTNDDGIYAKGLWALYEILVQQHDVTVIAPDQERSAISHAITLFAPLRSVHIVVNGGFGGYAVNGTPADCVKLGLHQILNEPPDIVISGINPGANVGANINYSGTAAAAKEAALSGHKAFAVSINSRQARHVRDAARFISNLIETLQHDTMPAGSFLNINIPDLPLDKIQGVCISKQWDQMFPEYYEKRKDPRNQTYFWAGIHHHPEPSGTDTDIGALHHNCISITPIKCDMTDHNLLTTLKKHDFKTLTRS